MRLERCFGFILCCFLVTSWCKQFQFFQFYDQNQPVSSITTKERMNFATLGRSAFVGRQWSLCSSMFVGFVRGRQAFFAVSTEDTRQPWITIYLTLDDGSFRVQLKVMGKSYLLGSQKGRLKIHAWSNICASIDGISGHLAAVVDGHSLETLSINELKTREGINLINRLVLGITWIDSDRVYQSESWVGNVHAYDSILPLSMLEEATEFGDFPESAALAWNPGSDWIKTGDVFTRSSDLIQSIGNKEFLVFSEVDSWESCAKLCPKVSKGGQMPPVGNTEIKRKLRELGTPNVYIPAPYSDLDKEGTFLNIYNKTQLLDTSLFGDGEPNDGRHGNCVMWNLKMDGTLRDEVCRPMAGINVQCFCLVEQNVLLKLRGLCSASYLDSMYTVKYENSTIKLRGMTGTEINLNHGEWKAATTGKDEKETKSISILASPGSYLLGKHDWIISKDSKVCSSQNSASASFYRTSLKLSGCDDNEFTCWDGECVPMEERCDQVFDCSDQSDERDCQMLVLEDSYQTSVPPLLSSLAENGKRVVPPVKVNVSLELIEVLGVNEKENQIEAKIKTTLKWFDHRINFYNLKKEIFLNTLRITDVKRVWSPKIIFSNTKESVNIQDGLDQAIMHVARKGNSTPSGRDKMDETDIFKGKENPLHLHVEHTNFYRCKFQLQFFPFDTQVFIFQFYKVDSNKYFFASQDALEVMLFTFLTDG